jgi:hypothetical protein
LSCFCWSLWRSWACLEILLLLLVFLVLFHVASVWSGGTLDRLKVSRADSGIGASMSNQSGDQSMHKSARRTATLPRLFRAQS